LGWLLKQEVHFLQVSIIQLENNNREKLSSLINKLLMKDAPLNLVTSKLITTAAFLLGGEFFVTLGQLKSRGEEFSAQIKKYAISCYNKKIAEWLIANTEKLTP
jgi:hypothetical protein